MIPIYNSEKDIADRISANSKIIASCQVLPRKNKLNVDFTKLSIATEYDKDLYRLYAIMVSTGINKNDDVFTKNELWASKDTPIDKPLNIEHSPRTIIGHIIESSMINDQYDLVEDFDEKSNDDETYHILTSGVIYRHLKSVDEELEKECARLVEEIDNGEWFVSMECLFADFDYALIHPVFGKRFIQRNETTAFLTKYLRVYGGEGFYNSMKIGRVLKGLLFSGKGLVKNPANPNSVILNNVDAFTGTYASLSELNITDNMEEVSMANDFEAKYTEAQNEIKELRDRLVQAGEEQHKNDLKAKDDEITQLTATIADMQKKIDELTVKFNEVAKVKEVIEGAKASLDTKVKELETENNKLMLEKASIDRISILVSAGVKKEEAEKLVERFISVSDEQFAEIVELQKKLINVCANVEEEVVEVEEEVTVEEVAEEVEVADDASLSTEENVEEASKDELNKLCASVASWFDSAVLKNKVSE